MGIDYQHIPELGILGSERHSLNSTSQYSNLFDRYRIGLASQEDALLKIIDLVKSEPSVLVCMEADPLFCHRNVLAHYLKPLMNMPIKHLGCVV